MMGLEEWTNLLDGVSVTILSLVVRFGVAGAWGVVICFCQETFPTVVRSTALGICCLVANTGGVLAPQIAFVGSGKEKKWNSLAFVIKRDKNLFFFVYSLAPAALPGVYSDDNNFCGAVLGPARNVRQTPGKLLAGARCQND